jgi:hypothetical protein
MASLQLDASESHLGHGSGRGGGQEHGYDYGYGQDNSRGACGVPMYESRRTTDRRLEPQCANGRAPSNAVMPPRTPPAFTTAMSGTLGPLGGVEQAPEQPEAADDDVSVVYHGKSFCGWSNRQRDAVQKAAHPKCSYSTEVPEGCPSTRALPATYAMKGGACKVHSVGFNADVAGTYDAVCDSY